MTLIIVANNNVKAENPTGICPSLLELSKPEKLDKNFGAFFYEHSVQQALVSRPRSPSNHTQPNKQLCENNFVGQLTCKS